MTKPHDPTFDSLGDSLREALKDITVTTVIQQPSQRPLKCGEQEILDNIEEMVRPEVEELFSFGKQPKEPTLLDWPAELRGSVPDENNPED